MNYYLDYYYNHDFCELNIQKTRSNLMEKLSECRLLWSNNNIFLNLQNYYIHMKLKKKNTKNYVSSEFVNYLQFITIDMIKNWFQNKQKNEQIHDAIVQFLRCRDLIFFEDQVDSFSYQKSMNSRVIWFYPQKKLKDDRLSEFLSNSSRKKSFSHDGPGLD